MADALLAMLASLNSAIALGVPGLEEDQSRVRMELQQLLSGRTADTATFQIGAPAASAASSAPSNGASAARADAGSARAAASIHSTITTVDATTAHTSSLEALSSTGRITLVATAATASLEVLSSRLLPRPPVARKIDSSKPERKQSTLFAAFGPKTVTSMVGTGSNRTPVAEHIILGPMVIDCTALNSVGLCFRGCGKGPFSNLGAKATHEKTCQGRSKGESMRVSRTSVEPEDESAKRKPEEESDDEGENEGDSEDEDADDTHEPSSKCAKFKGNGRRDRRCSNKGNPHRQRHTLMFKLTVIDHIQALVDGGTQSPVLIVAGWYKGLSNPSVYEWWGKREEIRAALTTKKEGHYKDARVLLDSKRARRLCLGGGRNSKFPLAEERTYAWLKEKRALGLRIGPRAVTARMKKEVQDIYGPAAALLFKASKKWRRNWCRRFSVSLKRKSNKKSLSALQRLPKIVRYLARLRRRLQHGPAGKAAMTALSALIAQEPHPMEVDIRSHLRKTTGTVLAAQGSSGLPLDCGWCALVNVTSNAAITAAAAVSIAKGLEDQLSEEDLAGNVKSPARHFCPGTGNYSGGALKALATTYHYGLYRLSREREGECGHARALLKGLSLLDNKRVCGAIWRIGGDVSGHDAASGHWLCASHLNSTDGNWESDTWVFKDSIGSRSEIWTCEKLMTTLDDAEKERREFFVVIDLN